MLDLNKVLSKEEMYMLLAMSAATNSKDPSTQVGACYVSCDGKVLSVGCNKAPDLWNENNFPWGSNKELGIKNTKYPYVIHAEMAAMSNYKGQLKDFENGTLYINLFPCINCAKLIVSLKIKKVVYLNARENCEDFECANILFENSGVECIKFENLVKQINNVTFDMNGDEKSCIKIKSIIKH